MAERAFFYILVLLLSTTSISSLAAKSVTVTVQATESIRDIAKAYLGDANLWPDILRANRLDSALELKPGMSLQIPVRRILDVQQALERTQALIYQANQSGAQLLATTDISAATQHYTAGLERRKKGRWTAALGEAREGMRLARRALDSSLANRDSPAEAIVAGAGGKVQRRKSADLYWKSASLGDLLVERESLRTLSRSFAMVRFRDTSQLRLNANSQIRIRRLRQDRITKRETADIVLYGGDMYALLGGARGQKQDVDVAVEGVVTDISSNKFWVGRTEDRTRLANYDGLIDVSAAGRTVRLNENQGTLIDKSRPPTTPISLLSPPELLMPKDDAEVYRTNVELAWSGDKRSGGYWLELALDPSFDNVVINRRLKGSSAVVTLRNNGLYYWRLAAITTSGLPGPKSRTGVFQMQKDNQPPYLVLSNPEQDAVLRKQDLRVTGLSEAKATVTLNGLPVEVGEDGGFEVKYHLHPGANSLVIIAEDPAGNMSKLKRSVRYMPDRTVQVRFGDDLPRLAADSFVVSRSLFTLRGRTEPKVGVEIRSEQSPDIDVRTVADAQGRFQVNLDLDTVTTVFDLRATLPSGFSSEYRFSVSLDTTPPRIVVEPSPVSRTADAVLWLSGRVTGGGRLSLGGQSVELAPDGRFTSTVNLQPGRNTLRLEAADQAGNTTSWRQRVVLDQAPPEVLGYRLSKRYANGRAGTTVRITVQVHDDGGMRAGAPFVLTVGDYRHVGFLRLCSEKTCYHGTVQLPRQAKGRIKLVSVELQDHLGNTRKYHLE